MFLYVFGAITIVGFLLVSSFNYYYIGLSKKDTVKFTMVEVGILCILSIFLLFNNGYIGILHFTEYTIGIIVITFLIGSFIFKMLVDGAVASFTIGSFIFNAVSGLISYLKNLIDGTPNGDNGPHSDGQSGTESPSRAMLEEVPEDPSRAMLEEVPEDPSRAMLESS